MNSERIITVLIELFDDVEDVIDISSLFQRSIMLLKLILYSFQFSFYYISVRINPFIHSHLRINPLKFHFDYML